MDISSLSPSEFLRTIRCTDIDQFRQAFKHVQIDFIPISAQIATERAVLTLPDCEIYVLHTFPRIIDGVVEHNATFVGFTMSDDFPVRINGRDKDGPALCIGQGGAAYKMVEFDNSKFASIVFRPAIIDRGWASATKLLSYIAIPASAEQRLRQIVKAAFRFASDTPDDFRAPGAAMGVQEQILSTIDHALQVGEADDLRRAMTSSRYFDIAQKIETILADNIDRPIYSGDLASQIGVSVRTLHNAILRYRGMSMHRYLRLKRLWAVRRQLLTGGSQIKACAIANGFWHLGEFAALYAGHFGESPSQTLARARLAS